MTIFKIKINFEAVSKKFSHKEWARKRIRWQQARSCEYRTTNEYAGPRSWEVMRHAVFVVHPYVILRYGLTL